MKRLACVVCALFMLASCRARGAQTYYQDALDYINSGNYTKGLEYARKAERAFGTDSWQWKEVVVLQGEAFLWDGREEEALAEFNRALDMLPEDDDMILDIAATCFRTQRYDVLKKFCEDAILSGKYSDKSEGLLYYYLGHLDFARMNYEQSRYLFLCARERFLKSGVDSYDKELDDLLERIGEMEKLPYISVYMEDGLRMMQEQKDFVLVDVRRLDEYEQGHIPGAVLLTSETITEEKAMSLLPDKNQRIYVYCRSGRRSKNASQLLSEYGYTNIIEIGGILDYLGPIEK